MLRKSKKIHRHIENFNPDITLLESAYRDFSAEMEKFDAGSQYKNFNDFIKTEALQYKSAGNGVTYVVWNVLYDDSGREIGRDIVAYYTLASTAIPYEDRLRNDEKEAQETGEKYDIQICGIPAIEIKMYAVNEMYQDIFYEYEGEDLPISAWIIKYIVEYVNLLSDNVLGLKALFLHSVPEAEKFYITNGFNPIEINMQPLYSLDSEYKAMYLTLKEVHMNYED